MSDSRFPGARKQIRGEFPLHTRRVLLTLMSKYAIGASGASLADETRAEGRRQAMRRFRMLLIAAAAVGLLLLAVPAHAQQRISGGNLEQPKNPNIQGITEDRGVADNESGSLPFTGADIT